MWLSTAHWTLCMNNDNKGFLLINNNKIHIDMLWRRHFMTVNIHLISLEDRAEVDSVFGAWCSHTQSWWTVLSDVELLIRRSSTTLSSPSCCCCSHSPWCRPKRYKVYIHLINNLLYKSLNPPAILRIFSSYHQWWFLKLTWKQCEWMNNWISVTYILTGKVSLPLETPDWSTASHGDLIPDWV